MSTESMTMPQGRLRGFADSFGRLNRSVANDSKGAARVRRTLGALTFGYASLLVVRTIAEGQIPAWGHVLVMLLGVALFSGRGGPFVRAWGPVVAGVMAYAMAGQFAEKLNFSVHYMPQIDADRIIGLGQLPTVWLQEHLYTGRTGPLEAFVVLMYASHFIFPLLLGFYIWWARKGEGFATLMFGILFVSILGEITFVLAPTAPPWMAADHGLIPPVHHVIRQALFDLHLGAAGNLKDTPGTYNIVAALPSLHAAWPLIGMLVCRRFGLPRWVYLLQVGQFTGVLFSIVYAGEHYVIDAVAGVLYALVAWRVVLWLLGMRESRKERSSGARAPAPTPEPVPAPAALGPEPAVAAVGETA